MRDAAYRDSYRVAAATSATPVGSFFAIFGHRPWWMKLALVLRHQLGRMMGLDSSSVRSILRPERREHAEPGSSLAGWQVYESSASENVVGRDNRHLDFRLSVAHEQRAGARQLRVSTACITKNRFGTVYLKAIAPLHRRGLRWLIARAALAGRL